MAATAPAAVAVTGPSPDAVAVVSRADAGAEASPSEAVVAVAIAAAVASGPDLVVGAGAVDGTRAAAGRVLLRPWCLVAMAVLVVNDHWSKARFGAQPGWGAVTGKVSDVAGLVFFPLLLVSLVSLAGVAAGRRHLVGAVVVTGVGFAAIKVVPAAAATYAGGLAAVRWVPAGLVAMCTAAPRPPLPSIDHVMDATDCLSLPALWLSYRIGRRDVRP